MPITFDGPNTTITLESGVTVVEAADIYSRWKEWLTTGDNAKFLPAFRVVGGDPVTASQNAGSYFFIQNQYGWRIRPPEEDIEVIINGNFVAEDSLQPFRIPTIGSFNTSVDRNFSSLTTEQIINSGSGLSAEQDTKIDELWKKQGLDPDNPITFNPDGSFTVGGITITAEDLAGAIRQTRA
jgi:hypothetical protein